MNFAEIKFFHYYLKGTEMKYSLFILFFICSLNLYSADLLEGEEALALLKKTGYVIYLRHAATDHSQDDKVPVDLNDCTTQRNLSEKGITQSKSIADYLKRNNIKIGKALSSPFCRCVDTAKLIARRYFTDKNLYFAISSSQEMRASQSRHLRILLSSPPYIGTNTLIVSHTANLKEAADIWPKEEGEAYIFEPLGNKGFNIKGVIKPENWLE